MPADKPTVKDVLRAAVRDGEPDKPSEAASQTATLVLEQLNNLRFLRGLTPYKMEVALAVVAGVVDLETNLPEKEAALRALLKRFSAFKVYPGVNCQEEIADIEALDAARRALTQGT